MEFVPCMDLYFLILRNYECLRGFRPNAQMLLSLSDHLQVRLDQPGGVSISTWFCVCFFLNSLSP